MAEKLGQPFMPWQRFVADVGCEIDPATGLPAYREVVVTIPRQSGKTTLFLSWQINRCVSRRWQHPQRSAFTAQTGKDARDKWIDELFPLIRNSALKSLVATSGSRLVINEGMGNESIRFKTGSMIRLLSTSTSSGHSKTLHQAVMDEVWHDIDDRRAQGLRPAMITIRDAQLLVCSTAGTETSVVLNRKVETGRKAVLDDLGNGVAYFEWSALEGWDPDDEDSYFTFSPALCPDPPCRCAPPGENWRHTITLEALRAERGAMERPEFMRAYGNIPTGLNGVQWQVMPETAYEAAGDSESRAEGAVALGISMERDRSVVYIGFIGRRPDGLRHMGLKERLTGSGEVVEKVKALKRERAICAVVIGASDPARSLLPDFKAAGIEVLTPGTADVAAECGAVYDAIAGVGEGVVRDMRHSCQEPLRAAFAGAVKKKVNNGNAWVWERLDVQSETAPLYAITNASYGFRVSPPADYDPLNSVLIGAG